MKKKLIKFSILTLLSCSSTLLANQITPKNNKDNLTYKVYMSISKNCVYMPVFSGRVVFKSQVTKESEIKYNITDHALNAIKYSHGEGVLIPVANLATYTNKKNQPSLILTITLKKEYEKEPENLIIGGITLNDNQTVNDTPTTNKNSVIFSLERNANENQVQYTLKALQNDDDTNDKIYDLSGLNCKLEQKNHDFIFNCSCL